MHPAYADGVPNDGATHNPLEYRHLNVSDLLGKNREQPRFANSREHRCEFSQKTDSLKMKNLSGPLESQRGDARRER